MKSKFDTKTGWRPKDHISTLRQYLQERRKSRFSIGTYLDPNGLGSQQLTTCMCGTSLAIQAARGNLHIQFGRESEPHNEGFNYL